MTGKDAEFTPRVESRFLAARGVTDPAPTQDGIAAEPDSTTHPSPRRGHLNPVAVLLAVAVLAFLLPFATVSCDGETVSFTGL